RATPAPNRTSEARFCCDARSLTCYTPPGPWVWGHRDETARLHHSARRRDVGVAARGARAAASDAGGWVHACGCRHCAYACRGRITRGVEGIRLRGGSEPGDRIPRGEQ